MLFTNTTWIDRVLAAAWVQKLLDSNAGSEELRTSYLKVLLFVLNRKSLCGPFLENPNSFGRLEEFSESKVRTTFSDFGTIFSCT